MGRARIFPADKPTEFISFGLSPSDFDAFNRAIKERCHNRSAILRALTKAYVESLDIGTQLAFPGSSTRES